LAPGAGGPSFAIALTDSKATIEMPDAAGTPSAFQACAAARRRTVRSTRTPSTPVLNYGNDSPKRGARIARREMRE
jgi:hypothetical protein